MNNDQWGWVDEREKEIEETQSAGYFKIVEGKNEFVLLSHFAPLSQVWDGKRYRPAEEGDKNVSVKGICWVLQDGLVKQAMMPYTVVKEVRALRDNEDWEFAIPFPHTLTLSAKGAGTKEVEYSLTPSPKKIDIPQEVIDELAKKPTPEDIVEKIKGGSAERKHSTAEEEGIDLSAESPF